MRVWALPTSCCDYEQAEVQLRFKHLFRLSLVVSAAQSNCPCLQEACFSAPVDRQMPSRSHAFQARFAQVPRHKAFSLACSAHAGLPNLSEFLRRKVQLACAQLPLHGTFRMSCLLSRWSPSCSGGKCAMLHRPSGDKGAADICIDMLAHLCIGNDHCAVSTSCFNLHCALATVECALRSEGIPRLTWGTLALHAPSKHASPRQ